MKKTIVLILVFSLVLCFVFSNSSKASLLTDNIHPRLYVTPTILTKLKAARFANTNQWQKLDAFSQKWKGRSRSDIMGQGRGLRAYSLAVAWLVYRGTSEESANVDLRDKLLEIVQYYVDLGKASAGELNANWICILFDMMYNDMTQEQRTGLANSIIKSITDARWETYHTSPKSFEVHGQYRGMIPVGTAGLALSGTPGNVNLTEETIDDKAADYIDHGINLRWYGKFLPGLKILGEGGGRPDIHYLTQKELTQWATMYYNSTGVDLMAETPWFKDQIKFLLMELTPENWSSSSGTSHYPHYNLHGDGYRYKWAVLKVLKMLAFMLTHHYPSLPESAQLTYLWTNTYGGNVMEMAGEEGMEFSFFNTDITPVTPSLKAHFANGIGRVFMRSGWDADPITSSIETHISFQAGDKYFSHQGMDQGAFTIYKYGDLAVMAGLYDGGGTARPSYIDHKSTCSSTNTILIYNPNEKFEDYSFEASVLNYGGQRTYLMKSEYAAADWSTTRFNKMNTGDILAYEHGVNYTYVRGDITQAYNSTRYTDPGQLAKVSWVSRDFLYLRPSEYIVMVDKIKSTDASYKKKILIHTRKEPTITGTKTTIEENNTGTGGIYTYDGDLAYVDSIDRVGNFNGGRLFIKSIFPETHLIRKIGGSRYYKYTGFNESIAAESVSSTSFTVDGDRWLDFLKGRCVKADCGIAGIKEGWIASRTYDPGTDKTTVEMDIRDNLSEPLSSLVSVKWGFKSTENTDAMCGRGEFANNNPTKEGNCAMEGKYPIPTVYSEYRLELENSVDQTDDIFLTVMLPTSSSVTNMAETVGISNASGNITGNMIGVQIKDSSENLITLFSNTYNNDDVVGNITYTLDISASSRHILFDLKPNRAYSVALDGSVLGDFITSNNGSLEFVNTSTGTHTFGVSVSGSDIIPPAFPVGLQIINQ